VSAFEGWGVVDGEDLGDEFAPAGDVHLGEDSLEVVAHGVNRDVELGCDVAVGEAARLRG
jgi:hypothetical protein